MDMSFDEQVQAACDSGLKIIGLEKLKFRPMRRKGDYVNTSRGFAIGRTNLKTGLITIDVFTPKFRKPKAIASILRVLAHEAAHHQKPPYRSRFKGHIINRSHYPVFYRQVNRNIKKFKQDKFLKQFFIKPISD